MSAKFEHGIPAVSVILPTYNRAAFLGEAVASVLAQSFRNFELIIIDDGSSDSTAEVVCSFIDPRLVFLQQENRGRSAARNRALGMARGRYIAFLDSDDVYLEDKLERQIAYMERRPDVDMIYTSAYCIDERGNLLEGRNYVATVEGNIYEEVAFFQPVTITLPTVMVRREVIENVGGFDEAMDRFEDTDLWRRIAKKHRIGIIKEPTCRLRTHTDNTLRSQDPAKIIAAIEYYVAKIFQEDADMDAAFLRRGASLLYEYYGLAFVSVPAWRHHGFALLRKSILSCPPRFAAVAKAGLKVFAGSLARQYMAK